MKTYKNIINYLLVGSIFLVAVSCNKHNYSIDKEHSVLSKQIEPKNAFDRWLDTNFVKTYNINFKYKIDDKDIDYKYNLVPAKLENSMKLAKIIKHAWLEAYTEITGGPDFLRKNAPAILPVIGSAAWNGDGTMTLGTAEGGLKITLYMGNWLDPTNIDELNQYFFKTMHHEFTHILQQAKYYPNSEFDVISKEDYRPTSWFNRKSPEYEKLGFITAYAGCNPVEDITEVTACYITMSDQKLAEVFENAGDEGKAKLDQKIAIMKRYMKETWNIDMDQLRKIVHRRMQEIAYLPLIEASWQSLIQADNATRSQSFEYYNTTIEALRSVQPQIKEHMSHCSCCQAHSADLLNIINK